MTALLDTGLLLASMAENDNLHEIAVIALEEEPDPILPDVVLPELGYMVLREIGYPALIAFIRAVAAGELPLESIALADLARAADILEKYADSRVDFVDCVIVAMAERLNVTRILTVDRQHFSLFRPKHCPAFEILP